MEEILGEKNTLDNKGVMQKFTKHETTDIRFILPQVFEQLVQSWAIRLPAWAFESSFTSYELTWGLTQVLLWPNMA